MTVNGRLILQSCAINISRVSTRRANADVMAQFDQFACPVMCALACLHPDVAGRQIFEEGQMFLSPYAPLQNDVPVGVKPW
ncbi:MAG: hypothetical protein Q4P24_07085, partial [Rhodobacterales bacterium]|nr:hypothetical protein [Rhodobacterales bacterium]